MRIAGVYASAFFIELAEYFILFFFDFSNCSKCIKTRNKNIFFIFKTVVNMHKLETAMNHTPVYTFGLGYPPMTKTNLFTFKTH